MADFAASILAPVVESGVKYVVAVIKRQFIYLCCFVSNITGLEDEAKKLDDSIQGVQAKVDAAKNNLQDIHPEVTSWFGGSNKFKDEMNIILEQVPNVKGVAARFSLSRRAIKTREAMAQHREKCKLFDDVSLPPPSAASRPTPLGTTYEFDSRKKIEQDIMTTLRDNTENMIGICGMGGLGKTTMAKKIMNRVLEEHIFQEVVIVVVSQSVNELKIQVEIGGSLGLKNLDCETSQVRVQKLNERLTSSEKRTLVVLDDVWRSLKLNELGIPCNGDSKACTVLITSRNGDALRGMDVKQVFGMEQLSEEDAWFMFREKAGSCVEDRKLKSIAEKVVKKCRGLPIALAAVGAALKDEKSKSIWKDTLMQLKKANPKDTPGFIADVYNPLIVSYDRLDSEEAKFVFLLCCLYPEDEDIPVEMLAYFWMGLRKFDGMGSVEEARDRMCSLIKSLKSRSLLLDSENEDHVRMHDVVRDVCIFVAKQKGYVGDQNDRAWISSLVETELHVGINGGFPNLRLLFLDGAADLEVNMDSAFFEGLRELHVLCISYYEFKSFPLAAHSLKHLQILKLGHCENLETLSGVGNLVNLKVLICIYCRGIEELPEEIGELKHLKLLDLTGCWRIQSIAPGVISRLDGLEELKMLGSFCNWTAAGDTTSAWLREVGLLTELTCLEIEIVNPALAAENLHLSSKLESFEIRIGSNFHSYIPEGSSSSKKMVLVWEGSRFLLGNWIKKLLKETEYLYLSGDGADNWDFEYIPNIRWLKIEDYESVKNLNVGTKSMDVFPHMERLQLSNLPRLQDIYSATISMSFFQNLKKIELKNLQAVKQLWRSSAALPQLGSLQIYDCEMMERVFMWNEEDETKTPATLFPQLTSINILRCLKMRSFMGTISNSITADIDDDDHSSHFFCNPQQVLFSSLKVLVVQRNPFCGHNITHVSSYAQLEDLSFYGYAGSSSLFTPTVAKNLVNLNTLRIEKCDEVVQVIEGGEININVLFPKLRHLRLKSLSKLECFCDCDAELPSLKKATIWKCPNIRPLATLDLEYLETDLDNYLEAPFKLIKGEPLTHEIPLLSFHGLQVLWIKYYEGSMSIFSSAVAGSLVNLKTLYFSRCFRPVKVIEEEEGVGETGERRRILFPKLEKMQLKILPEVETFCEWKHDVELPSLKDLTILHCSKITRFTLGFVSTPKLEYVDIDHHEYTLHASTGINGALLAQQKESMEMHMLIEMEMEIKKWKKMEKKMEKWMETNVDGKEEVEEDGEVDGTTPNDMV